MEISDEELAELKAVEYAYTAQCVRVSKAKAILRSPIDWPQPYKLIKSALAVLEGVEEL